MSDFDKRPIKVKEFPKIVSTCSNCEKLQKELKQERAFKNTSKDLNYTSIDHVLKLEKELSESRELNKYISSVASDRNIEIIKLGNEKSELQKYREGLDSPMEQLIMVLPSRKVNPTDLELVLEAVEHIKELQKRVEKLESENLELKDPTYCPVCGSCGEQGCCSAHMCKYPPSASDWKDQAEENLEKLIIREKEFSELRKDVSVSHKSLETQAITIESLQKELDKFKRSEKELSDAYLRIRELLGAWDTKWGGSDRFEVTENKIKSLLKGDLK